MTYILKNTPEDFIVKEISPVQPQKEGRFAYFLLKKRNYTTLKALELVAKALKIPLKAFGYAGNKDRRAVTEQVCSVDGTSRERLEKVQLENIEIKFLGRGAEPVHLGQLEANAFEIIVRNLDWLPELKPRFVNYFGKQRFSSQNPEIGRLLVKRDFKCAAGLLAENFGEMRPFTAQKNYLAALRCVPRKTLVLFVHAYQSLLWNRLAAVYAEKHKANIAIPIIGFGSVVDDECALKILEEEGITPRDFIIKELPEISAEGGERELYAEAKNLSVGRLEDDECYPGKKKVLLKFALGRGCYATEFVRQQFSIDQQEPRRPA